MSLRRAGDVRDGGVFASPGSSPSPLGEALAWPLVRRRAAAPNVFLPPASSPEPAVHFVVPSLPPSPSRARRLFVRGIATLSLVALAAVAVYAGSVDTAARRAVAGWATLGQLR